MSQPSKPVERILLPTDLSEFSILALRHALGLASKFKARLKVVYVIPQIYPVGEAVLVGAPWLASPQIRKLAEGDLHAFMAGAREAHVDHELEVREGEPWREIVASAEETPADLVVMGTHGRRGAERLFLGSVAERLIHRLPCPVMTVCHEEGRTGATPGLLGRILCATDFSESSERAFQFALGLASSLGAKVTLLHAIDYMPDLGEARYRMVIPDVEPLRQEIERIAAERLAKALEAGRKGFPDVEVATRVAVGRAYQEILHAAEGEGADLIVVGAQGHGWFEHMLSGSNALQVIRRATCPVLTVRPQRTSDPAWNAKSPAVPPRSLQTGL